MTGQLQEPERFEWFVGIDWGTASHAVHAADGRGELVGECTIAHTGAGLEELVEWLGTVSGGVLSRVAVALETPRGAVVDTLLDRGVAVFTLNPKQLDRFRDRFSVAGAKDDRLDARVLGSALRTDRHCFRQLAPEDPRIVQVRELTRMGEELAAEFQANTNRLREQVHRIAPSWGELSPNADDPWFWKLLELAQTPAHAHRLRPRTIEQLLRAHRIRRVTADEVLTVLKQRPVVVAPGTVDAVTQHIALLLPRLRLVLAQRQQCTAALSALIDDMAQDDPPTPSTGAAHAGPSSGGPPPSDIAILQSVAGAGTMVISTLIAEAMGALVLRDYAALRAASGVAPVRRQTGKDKRGQVGMRRACNPRLRQAMYFWAMASTRLDGAVKRYYAALRARGHSHGRALRSVADRWLRILIAMLKARTLYNPARFAAPAAEPA
jgi:transposase